MEGEPSPPEFQALSVCDDSHEQAEQEITDNSALLHTFVSKVHIGNII
jgi:hypothetical protein